MNISPITYALSTNQITKNDLALRAGITRRTLDAIISGSDLRVSTLEAISSAMSISVCNFFTETNHNCSQPKSFHMNYQKLKTLVQSSGLTKREIANRCKISRQSLDLIINGSDTRLSHIETIASVLGVSMSILFDEDANFNATNGACQQQDDKVMYLEKLLEEKDSHINDLKNIITILQSQLNNLGNG